MEDEIKTNLLVILVCIGVLNVSLFEASHGVQGLKQ